MIKQYGSMIAERRINLNKLSIIFLLLIPISISIFLYSYGLQGNDFWWHYKVGEWICQNNKLPCADIFSWYGINNHIPWHSQEWLADVIFYIVYSRFGEKVFFLFCVLFESAFLVTIIICNYRYIKDRFLFSIIFLSFTSIAFNAFIYGRPHMFSGLLLFVQLLLLNKYYYNRGKTKYLIPIPVITVLWSNLHGGSANLSYIICFVFFLVSLFPFKSCRVVNFRRSRKVKISLLIVTLISIAAIFVNPQGLYVFIYPYENISNSFMLSVISEWYPPDAKDIGHVIYFFFPFLLFLLSMLLGKKKIVLIDGIMVLLFLFLFLRSRRFGFYLYIIISVFGYKYFPKVKTGRKKDSSELGHILAIVLSLVLLINSFGAFFSELNSKEIIERVLDKKFCELIKVDKVSRIYNDYNYSETLIFNDIECFVDARVDLFADNIFEDSMNLCYLENLKSHSLSVLPEKIIDKYKFDAVIIQNNRPLKAYLDSHPDKYSLIESDENTSYYHVNRFFHNIKS